MTSSALFADRRDAGRRLAVALEVERGPKLVVVGLARGGIETAAEVAGALDAPLDVVAVRKVGHPRRPEYGIGAVTPDHGVYVRARDGVTETELVAAVQQAKAKSALLDRRLHAKHPPLDLNHRNVVVVDDGLATGATMIAALRWARAAGAARVIAAVPIAATESLRLVVGEADAVVCLHASEELLAISPWYGSFDQVDDQTVISLLDENRAGAKSPRTGSDRDSSRPRSYAS